MSFQHFNFIILLFLLLRIAVEIYLRLDTVVLLVIYLDTSVINCMPKVCRGKLRFSGALSVLQILAHVGREDKISVLVSSTLGPAAVWTWSLSANKSFFEWKRTSVLEDTRGHDAIICSNVGEQSVGIGTYAGVTGICNCT